MSKKEKPIKFPLQPIRLDKDGVPRFVENKIVRFLLDAGPFDLNTIASLPGISLREQEQFAQLIGYSVSGFGSLSYSYHDTRVEADTIAEELCEKHKNKK